MVDESHSTIGARTSWPVDQAVREIMAAHRLVVRRLEEVAKLVQNVGNCGSVGIIVWTRDQQDCESPVAVFKIH